MMKIYSIVLFCTLLHSCGYQEQVKIYQISSKDSATLSVKEYDMPKSMDTLKFLKEKFGVYYEIKSKQIIDSCQFEDIKIISFGKFLLPDRVYLDDTQYHTIILDSLIVLGDGQYKISTNNVVYIYRKDFASGSYFLKLINNDEYMPDIAIFNSVASGNAYDISSLYKWDNASMKYFYSGEMAGINSK